MAVSLFAAEHGYLDDIELEKIRDFEQSLHDFANSEKKDLMDRINSSGEYNDDIKTSLKGIIEEFKSSSTW